MNISKIMQSIKGVNPGAYGAPISELLGIVKANDGKALDAACDAFIYGFLKGQRAEKSNQKKGKILDTLNQASAAAAFKTMNARHDEAPEVAPLAGGETA